MTYQRKTTKKTYSGILLEPIQADPKIFQSIYPESTEKAENMRLWVLNGARHERLKALAKHFGLGDIDVSTPEGKEQILWALAEEHVPGFKLANKYQRGRGRPSMWNGTEAFIWLSMIWMLVRLTGMSERQACQQFLDIYKTDPRFTGMTLDSFYARYKEMKKMDMWLEGGQDNLENTMLEQMEDAPEDIKKTFFSGTKKR